MIKKTTIWLFLAGLLVLGFLYLVYTVTNSDRAEKKVVFYKISDKERPKLRFVEKPFKNIGRIKVSETKKTRFEIENQGGKPLQIFSGSTNCGCTFGQVKKKGEESPIFGMHQNQDFFLSLAPEEKGEVEVIYKPFLMPVYGRVQRAAILTTNDPDHPEVNFVIEAFVE